MAETIRIDDMRLFAKVAEAKSFTKAAALLGVPKQTLSRRVAELERLLGVELMIRTTRRLHLTDSGKTYAERCSELVRLADEANRAVTDTDEVPRGTLRITADPVFGDAFLTGLVLEYARTWPEVRVDVVLTRRRVDRYCASPAYLDRRGAPSAPKDLERHDCLVVSDGTPARWPFRRNGRVELIPVSGRLTFTSFAMAHQAALAGLGIALFPEFACAADLRRKRLVPVLERSVVDVGSVWLIHAAHRALTARVRAFIALAVERFARQPPWLPPNATRSHARRSLPAMRRAR
jgi:DNA-binding transcriptional LysR family regulator